MQRGNVPTMTELNYGQREKVSILQAMFPHLSEKAVIKNLHDASWDADRAVDSLLNLEALTRSNSSSVLLPPGFKLDSSIGAQTAARYSAHFNPSPQQQQPSPHHQQVPQQLTKDAPKSAAVQQAHSIDARLLEGARNGEVEFVRSMLGACSQMPANKKPNLDMILLAAIEKGQLGVVRAMLDFGVASNGVASESTTPLLCALDNHQAEIARMLLQQYKADAALQAKVGGETPLHVAVKKSALQSVVKILLEKGAIVNAVEAASGQTALHAAVKFGDFDVVDKLLSSGADLFKQDKEGDTPLHVAIKTCGRKTQQVMLPSLLIDKAKEKASQLVNTRNNQGETALHLAVKRCYSGNETTTAFVDLVLRAQPSLSVTNNNGKTALQLAQDNQTVAGVADIVKLLTSRASSSSSPSIHNNRDDDDDDEEESLVRKPKALNQATKPSSSTAQTQATTTSAAKTAQPTTEKKKATLTVVARPASCPKRSPRDDDWLAVDNLRTHLTNLTFDEGSFDKEFAAIESATENDNLTCDFTSALSNVNKLKNRYKNILPLEATRVKLKTLSGIEGSDFISGNYVTTMIPGQEYKYICTQGPLATTVADFWRMVWEQGNEVIVMLANEVEAGKQKVYPYYPTASDNNVLFTDHFKLTLTSMEQRKDVVTRMIRIESITTQEKREISHFQYVGWPDQGIPSDSTGFIELVDLVDDTNKAKKSVVVHCSAGIGRTGTFCVVHSLINRMRLLLTTSFPVQLSIKDTVLAMRKQRTGMVQTEDQYKFCYLSLLEKLPQMAQLLDYKNDRWFYKNMTEDQATKLLKGRPTGSFLFRPSHQLGCIVVSLIDESGKLQHSRLTVTDNGFTIRDHLFATLADLVGYHHKMLSNAVIV